MDALTLKVEGNTLDPLALSDSIVSMTRMIRSLALDGAPELAIGEMRTGSAILGVIGPHREVAILNEGLESLKDSSRMPDGWSTATIDSLLEFRRTLRRRGVRGVSLSVGDSKSDLDESLLSHAEQAKESIPLSLGSAHGRLYRYINPTAGSARASIENPDDGEIVSVFIPSEYTEIAAGLVDKNVRVWGIVSRDPLTRRVVAIRLRGIERSKNTTARPLSSFRGAIAVPEGEEFDSVEVVRILREH